MVTPQEVAAEPEVDDRAGSGPLFVVRGGDHLLARRRSREAKVIGLDVGLITFDVTFDNSTGDFVSFSVVRVAGQRPALDSQICAALT